MGEAACDVCVAQIVSRWVGKRYGGSLHEVGAACLSVVDVVIFDSAAGGKGGVNRLADGSVARAGGGFEAGVIADGDALALGVNQPLLFQDARHCGDIAARDAEHAREVFVRQMERVGRRSITSHQEPARQALLQAVKQMAGHRLRDLRGQGLGIAEEQFEQCRLLSAKGQQRLALDSQCLSRRLGVGDERGSVGTGDFWQPDQSLGADEGRFDGGSVFRGGKQGNDPAGEKPCVMDWVTIVEENSAFFQAHWFQALREVFEDGRGEGSQQPIGRSWHHMSRLELRDVGSGWID